MALYEVQRLRGRDWIIDSVFDDKDLAIDTAKSIMGGGRPPPSIRVVEEGQNGGLTRTVFRQAIERPSQSPAAPAPARKAEVERAPPPSKNFVSRAPRADHRPPPKPTSSWLSIMVRLGIVAVVAVGGFGALLHYMSQR